MIEETQKLRGHLLTAHQKQERRMVVGERFETQSAFTKLSTTIKETPESDILKLLETHTQNFKNLGKTNCIAATKLYEVQNMSIKAVQERLDFLNKLYKLAQDHQEFYDQKFTESYHEKKHLQDSTKTLEDQKQNLQKGRDESKNVVVKLQQKITQQVLQQLFEVLNETCPAGLPEMLECLVGLIKGRPRVSADEIQVYVSDYQKLIYKMDHCNPHLIQIDHLESIEKRLDSLEHSFTIPGTPGFELNHHFVVLFAWAQNYAHLCRFEHIFDDIDETKADHDKRIEEIENDEETWKLCQQDNYELMNLETLEEEKEILEHYLKESLKNEEQRFMQCIVAQAQHQAFEGVFFENVNEYNRKK